MFRWSDNNIGFFPPRIRNPYSASVLLLWQRPPEPCFPEQGYDMTMFRLRCGLDISDVLMIDAS